MLDFFSPRYIFTLHLGAEMSVVMEVAREERAAGNVKAAFEWRVR